MRLRDVRVPLYDMLRAADAVEQFITGRTYQEYAEDLMLRSAVERQFEILGEAMARALRIEPALDERLVQSHGVVDFRNVIAHDYDMLSHATVWDIATRYLPPLRAAVAAALDEAG